MATIFTFNGRQVSLPGVYSQIKSAVNTQPLDLSSGNVVVIDKDETNPFGGGSGIAGQVADSAKSVYPFDNLNDFRTFIGGGSLYDYALPLFRPNGSGSRGVSRLYYVRALTTTAALLRITWANGVLNLRARHEGVVGNGVQGNETRASQTLTITNIGAASDTITVTANAVALGTFTSAGTGTTADAANAYAAIVNAGTYSGAAHGFSATAVGNVVTISAPANTGAAANTYAFAVANTGTAASVVGGATMAGGVNGSKLTRGLAMTMEAGTIDPAKYKVKFWRGSFTGNDSEGHAYGGVAEADTTPILLAESPESSSVTEIINWAKADFDFNNHIQIMDTSVATGSGALTAADLTGTAGNQLFGNGAAGSTAGTQAYNTARVTEVLDSIKNLDYTHILSLDGQANYNSADNAKLISHVVNDAKFEKFVWMGGGNDRNTFVSQSIAAANFHNTEKVVVCHGGCYVVSQKNGTGLKEKDSTYKAAHVLGRACGLPPQTPITFKGLGYAGEVHELKDSEKTQALRNGVLVTGHDGEIGTHVVVLGNNTLQQNTNVINTDGTSHLISVTRIKAQLSKELEVNMKRDLLGNQSQGPNVGTLTKEVVRTYVAKFLRRKTSTATKDGLIISFQDIVIEQRQDAYFVTFGFKVNMEINKIFITGTILDPNAN